MNEYKNSIVILLQGGALGFVGLIVGFCTIVDSISISTAFRYTVVAVISGALAFYLVGESIYEEYDYLIAIMSGWAFFFIAKGISVLLMRFSKFPIRTWKEIAPLISNLFKGGK